MDDASDRWASALLHWPLAVEHLEVKRDVAAGVARAEEGEVIGIGSGSNTVTAFHVGATGSTIDP